MEWGVGGLEKHSNETKVGGRNKQPRTDHKATLGC